VLDDDDESALAARILEQEHRLYPWVLQLLAEGRVVRDGRRVKIVNGSVNIAPQVNPPLPEG
jgi:phosphoribosylglycinamide formyltransferase-1